LYLDGCMHVKSQHMGRAPIDRYLFSTTVSFRDVQSSMEAS
jgi:hypothetical protein